jgi:cyanophycinase
MRASSLLAAFALAVVPLSVAPVGAQPSMAASPEYGPANGTLVIVGGGSTAGTGILEKFVELAGGPRKKFVIVPTAGGNRRANGELIPYADSQVLASWRRMGLTNVHMLHTHDPAVADTDEFAAVLRDADAVWFNGGRQWHIVDSYAGTKTYDAFHAVLARGGVIAGSSAGATIQGEYLVRGATAGPQIMMTDEPNHQEGFKFLRRSAIDQHIDTRNRWDDLTQVMQRFPAFIGIGISEGTAIIVRGDQFEVMGKWKVAVHDPTRAHQPWEKPWFVLGAGDVYDLQARRVLRLGTATPPPRR